MLHSRPATVIAVLCALSLPAAGCGSNAGDGVDAISVTDGTGRLVSLDQPAVRVASLVPSLTDWIVALGAAERLVARTDYDHHPAIAHLPSVGGGLDPSVEWLVAQRPDLVLAWPDTPNRSLVTRLESVGIPVYTAPVQTIEDALGAAEDLGRLLDVDSAAAQAVARVRTGLERVATAVAGRPRPSVLFLIGLAPITAAGPDTFLDQLLVVAGGRNAVADIHVLWPNLSLEEVVRRAPEIVIVASGDLHDPAASLGARPGWRDVPAVGAGRVYGVDPDVVHRPGPHIDRAAADLARLIHSDPR